MNINRTVWQVVLFKTDLVLCLPDLARVAAAAQPSHAGHHGASGDDVHGGEGRHGRELHRVVRSGAVGWPARGSPPVGCCLNLDFPSPAAVPLRGGGEGRAAGDCAGAAELPELRFVRS